MSVQLVLILILLAVFLIATVLPVHMGALALVAAFIAAYFIFGTDGDPTYDDAVFGFFPGSLFVVLVGVTYLFADREEQRHRRLAGPRRGQGLRWPAGRPSRGRCSP